MSNRRQFLGRLQKALGKAPGSPISVRKPDELFGPLERVMQPIAAEDVIGRFETELQKVSGSTHRASSAAQLDEVLQAILREHQAKLAVCTRNPIIAAAGIPAKLASMGVEVAAWPESGEAEARNLYREKAFMADVGISGVDFVLAESGSMVVSSRTEGTQLGSLAPPTHIAFYRRSQALASLEEVLARLPVPADPTQPLPGRSVVFITGPSRTADIEQILIRGVHGPKHVHAILLEDACLAQAQPGA
jgi:L-lactate dehydrogenase complex protein LldG